MLLLLQKIGVSFNMGKKRRTGRKKTVSRATQTDEKPFEENVENNIIVSVKCDDEGRTIAQLPAFTTMKIYYEDLDELYSFAAETNKKIVFKRPDGLVYDPTDSDDESPQTSLGSTEKRDRSVANLTNPSETDVSGTNDEPCDANQCFIGDVTLTSSAKPPVSLVPTKSQNPANSSTIDVTSVVLDIPITANCGPMCIGVDRRFSTPVVATEITEQVTTTVETPLLPDTGARKHPRLLVVTRVNEKEYLCLHNTSFINNSASLLHSANCAISGDFSVVINLQMHINFESPELSNIQKECIAKNISELVKHQIVTDTAQPQINNPTVNLVLNRNPDYVNTAGVTLLTINIPITVNYVRRFSTAVNSLKHENFPIITNIANIIPTELANQIKTHIAAGIAESQTDETSSTATNSPKTADVTADKPKKKYSTFKSKKPEDSNKKPEDFIKKPEVITTISKVLDKKCEDPNKKPEDFIKKPEVFATKSEVFDKKCEDFTTKCEIFDKKFKILDEKCEVLDKKLEALDKKFEVLDEKCELLDKKREVFGK